MATIDDIISRAQQVRDNTAVGSNTAPLVGGVMTDTAEHLKDAEEDITSLQETVAGHTEEIEALQETLNAIDDEPTEGSNNLVKSGGVYDKERSDFLEQNALIGEMYGGNYDVMIDLNDDNSWKKVGYNSDTGAESASLERVSIYIISGKGVVSIQNTNSLQLKGLAYFWDDNGDYIGYTNLGAGVTSVNIDNLLSDNNAHDIALSFYFDTNPTISIDDFLGYVSFHGVVSQNETYTGWGGKISESYIKANSAEDITNKMESCVGLNLFNPNDSDVLIGKYINGSQIFSGTYNSSGYIPVRGDTVYYCAKEISTGNRIGYRFVNYYDSDKQLISTISDSYITTFTTPATCAYVRVVFYQSNYEYAQVSEQDTYYQQYYVSLALKNPVGTDPNSIATREFVEKFNKLYGKKYTACGDSFTIGGYENSDGYPETLYKYQYGQYKGKQIVYPFIIGLRNSMNVINLAVNGMTMCDIDGSRTNSFTHGSNPVYKQIPLDSEYVTLKFGINDNNYSSPIGTIDDEVVTTFYGAWNVVMKWIADNLPFAHVGIIITNGASATYTDAVIAIAQKWGVAYLDEVNDVTVPLLHRVNRAGVSAYVKTKKMQNFSITYTTTAEHPNFNTHPNVYAHHYESTFVEDFLRRL